MLICILLEVVFAHVHSTGNSFLGLGGLPSSLPLLPPPLLSLPAVVVPAPALSSASPRLDQIIRGSAAAEKKGWLFNGKCRLLCNNKTRGPIILVSVSRDMLPINNNAYMMVALEADEYEQRRFYTQHAQTKIMTRNWYVLLLFSFFMLVL